MSPINSSQLNASLLQLFQAHGIDCTQQGDWIVFQKNNSKSSRKANASIVQEFKHQAALSVQMDVNFQIAPGRTIIESFAGIGTTQEAAVSDALHNFTANSFHVLLTAFLRPDHENNEQESQEEWIIGGEKRRGVVSDIGIRGKSPVSGEELVGWYEKFAQKLQEKSLEKTWGKETHWVRLYYAQSQGKSVACEVLLDNEAWEVMQSETAAFDWPSADAFYSVRVFLVIQGEDDSGSTADSHLNYLAEILTSRPDATEDQLHQALADNGVTDALADRAIKFTQIAWGRLLLDGLKINLSPVYLCFDAEGKVIETGLLIEEPYFIAATRLGPQLLPTSAGQRLAMTSADMQTVNNALNAGSKPENLVLGPAGVFLANPTSAGLLNAQKVISQHMASSQKPDATQKEKPEAQARTSGWQFWKR